MPDPRDFLPQPPWEGPPIPEGFVKAFRPSPEQVKLIQEINDKIRKGITYEMVTERIERRPVHLLSWDNHSASWKPYGFYSNEWKGAYEEFRKTPEFRALPTLFYTWRRDTPPGYQIGIGYKIGDTVTHYSSQVLVYGKWKDICAILSYLEPSPLYAYSFEAKQRGFGTSPPPWTKHWTWPELPAMPQVQEGPLPLPPPKKLELICAVCGRRFEEYRSGEEKLLDAVFGETYCPEHRGSK